MTRGRPAAINSLMDEKGTLSLIHLGGSLLRLVWGVVVRAADIHDGTKGHILVEYCLGYLERMNRIAEAKNTG